MDATVPPATDDHLQLLKSAYIQSKTNMEVLHFIVAATKGLKQIHQEGELKETHLEGLIDAMDRFAYLWEGTYEHLESVCAT